MNSEDRLVNPIGHLLGQPQMQPAHALEKMQCVDHISLAIDTKREYECDAECVPGRAQTRSSVSTRSYLSFALLSVLGLSLLYFCAGISHLAPCNGKAADLQPDLGTTCPQVSAIAPQNTSALLLKLEAEYQTQSFKLKAYESLGGAIRIPTVSYDDLAPPGQDERWEIFAQLHAYLENTFPSVHKTLRKTVVNKYALVYHWQGSDDSLKPILLTAHQDVVPVEPLSLDQWKQPPFSGLYDGEYIWGRGSCDDKPGLIGSLTAVEELLRKDFRPTRSVVLAYGIDEERGGVSGATAIRDYLLSTYGDNAFSLLVDEGGGYNIRGDIIEATPGVAEKGSLTARFEISTSGGHSSVPPRHTSIGMLAAVIKELEDHPHEPSLNRSGVYYSLLQCRATHNPGLSPYLRSLITRSLTSDKALHALEAYLSESDRLYPALAGTTQAADVIHGGVKVNALPEHVEVLVNHRISIHSSVGALQQRIVSIIRPIARQYGLALDAFGLVKEHPAASAGVLRVSDAFGTALEPAPVTPLGESGPFRFLSGTIIGVLGASSRTGYDKKVFIAPGYSTGNTDTKHYWKLTKHIFRYGHSNGADSYNGAHTVNEGASGPAKVPDPGEHYARTFCFSIPGGSRGRT